MGKDQSLQPIVERIYDVVVEPRRLEQLCDLWMQQLGNTAAGPMERFALLADPKLLMHVERVEVALEQVMVAGTGGAWSRSLPHGWVAAIRAAAFIAGSNGEIIAANDSARLALGVEPGRSISELPFEAADLDELSTRLAAPRVNGGPSTKPHGPAEVQTLLRLRLRSQPVPVLVQIVAGAGGDASYSGVVTTILRWPPELTGLLQNAFGLTSAEAAVLKELAFGLGVKDIAASSGRSESTLRTHVRELLSKTQTTSQIELIRLTLGLMDGFQPAARCSANVATGDPTGNGNSYETLVLADGRRLDYLVIGLARGAPFLLFPSDVGQTRLPASAESNLSARGLRMIVPIRAGYGWSSPAPANRPVHDVAIDDARQLMDHLGIARAPILALCEDLRLAVEMSIRCPGRITAAIALGALMPAHTPQHFQRMSKWSRFIIANARFAPRTLPFIALALFGLARRIGPKRFFGTLYGGSAGDLNILGQPEILDAIVKGSEITLRPGFTAHVAFAAEAVANFTGDWSDRLGHCPVPVILFNGDEDPVSPIETVREYANALPHIITLHECAGYGQILYPVWPAIADELEKFVVRP